MIVLGHFKDNKISVYKKRKKIKAYLIVNYCNEPEPGQLYFFLLKECNGAYFIEDIIDADEEVIKNSI
jgi:hypothetical protein